MEAIKQVARERTDTNAQSSNTMMARLIHLALAALSAKSPEDAGRIIVNRMHALVRTDRAIMVPLRGRKRILCVSGDLEVCQGQDNAFSYAVDEIRKAYGKEKEPRVIGRNTIPEEIKAPNARKALEAVGGTNLLWVPLAMAGGGEDSGYGLWLERWHDKPWTPEEIRFVSHAAVFFGHAMNVPKKKKNKSRRRKFYKLLTFPIFIFLFMLIPINARISAPVQVVPDHPHYVFAPFDGIVEELLVQPGQNVKSGDSLFRYDTRVLKKQLEEAQRGVAVELAELTRLEGAAYDDKDARAKIPVQKLEVQRRQAEVAFLKEQLDLSEVRSEADGVVVLDDADTLIGAPLQTGQMVMSVADPKQTKLKLHVAVSDTGIFKEGSPVFIRLDSNPLKMFKARVTRIGFDTQLSEKRIPSVQVDAVWEEDAYAVPGQRGRARIQGEKSNIGLVWFRKPLTRWRNRFGQLGF